jgi:integrase
MPTLPPHRLRWISHNEAGALLDSVGPRVPYLRDFITIGLNTGMRMGEMLNLEWSRVDLTNNVIYLTPKDQKDRRYGSVPINAQAREALLSRARHRAEHCPDAKYVFVRRDGSRIASVKKGFAAACEKAGIENFHIHDLRHTCAAWLVQAGVPLRTVAEILRHKDIRTTMRYAHLAPDDAQAGVAALDNVMQRSKNVVTDVKNTVKGGKK